MWNNPRLLHAIAGSLTALALVIFAFAGVRALLQSSHFPIQEIEVVGSLSKTDREDLERAVRGRIAGNFFATNLAGVRAGFEQLPWVRRAEVRRVWPDRLRVRIEEHVALARWGDSWLVNIYGERFAAQTDETLPVFAGPPGTELEVARRYRRYAELLAPLGAQLDRVILSPRFAWQLRLSNGLSIELGRELAASPIEERLLRFVKVYPATLGRIARRHEYVDLRYPNGFALRVPDLERLTGSKASG